MISNGYTLLEMADTLVFLWRAPTWPPAVRWFLSGLLVLLPALYLFRERASAFGARHLHFGFLTPRRLGVLAPALSLLLGWALWLGRSAPPLIQWSLTKEGVALQSPNGTSTMAWNDVASMRFDARDNDAANTSLILKSRDGREAWFILSWLQEAHREKLLAWITRHSPVRLGEAPSVTKPAAPK